MRSKSSSDGRMVPLSPSLSAPSEAIEDLGGRPLARPYGAVDRPVRDGRRLGPGPVNAPERFLEQPPVAREDPRREMRHRTAARPFLLPPSRLDELRR